MPTLELPVQWSYENIYSYLKDVFAGTILRFQNGILFCKKGPRGLIQRGLNGLVQPLLLTFIWASTVATLRLALYNKEAPLKILYLPLGTVSRDNSGTELPVLKSSPRHTQNYGQK